MWMVKQAQHEVTAFTDVKLQGVSANTRLYGDYTVSPSLTTGVEYARLTGPDKRVAVGAEGTISPGDAALRPYVTVKTGNLLGHGRRRFPRQPQRLLSDGGRRRRASRLAGHSDPEGRRPRARSRSRTFSLTPAPELDYSGMVTLDFNLCAQSPSEDQAGGAPERYDERNVVADSAEMNRHVANGAYDKGTSCRP